jgi:heme/copper-type cytochrome/quinol oxidase subunit 1
MLPAKLFAVLAIVFSICAGLAWLNPLPSVDIHVHATYFVFGPILVLLFCAVTSVNFAVLYYAAARFFHARWNRTLSVLHFSLFVCFGISFSVVFAVSTRVANGPDVGEALRWLVIPWLLGILSLVVCFVVFGVNLTLTVVQLVRARFASH